MRVLFPLDGSQRSLGAMEKALGLLKGAKIEATLFAVAQKGFEKAPDDRVEDFAADEDDEVFPTVESCDRMLGKAEARCRAAGVKPKCKVVVGKVAHSIVEEAALHDVVVMHRLGKSGVLEKLRLSNTERIARRAPCAVLLVE